MTKWLPNLAGRTGPRYQTIADAIIEAVGEGSLAPGDRLPPQRELAWRLGVTVGTVSRAYMLAEERGILSAAVGRGTFVRARDSSERATMLPVVDVPFDLGINMACSAHQGAALAEG